MANVVLSVFNNIKLWSQVMLRVKLILFLCFLIGSQTSYAKSYSACMNARQDCSNIGCNVTFKNTCGAPVKVKICGTKRNGSKFTKKATISRYSGSIYDGGTVSLPSNSIRIRTKYCGVSNCRFSSC